MTVDVAADSGAFARMIGGLLQANLTADPDKGRAIARTSGTVSIEVSDTGEVVGLVFAGGVLSVGSPGTAEADLRLVGTADVIMGLSTVPLRFGLPDLLSMGGRNVAGRWVTGGLEVHGLPRSALLLRTVVTLLSVL